MNLDPKSIAIIGLSDRPEKHGARVLRNLRKSGYQGVIYGVNPRRPEIDGVLMVGSVDELPLVDLALCAIPASAVPDSIRRLKGPSTVVVFSGGFRELDEAGAALQEELVAAGRAAGVRIIGPNSGGVMAPESGLAASFLTFLDRPRIDGGPVAVVSQSGGLLSYLHNVAAGRGQGVGAAVSTGNEADVTVAEAITAVAKVEGIRSICLIVETIRDGIAFVNAVQAAHRSGVRIAACHLGRSAASRHMLATHTGALATDRRVFEGVCRSLGMALAETPEEAFDVADVLARTGVLDGDSAGLVTHSGGLAILLNDLANDRSVRLPEPCLELTQAVEPFMQLGAIKNPLDMGAIIGGPHRFASVVEAFANDPHHAVVLAVSSAHPPAHTAERVEALLKLDHANVVHLWMAGDQADAGLRQLRGAGAAVVTEPRAAMAALAGAVAFFERDQIDERHPLRIPAQMRSEHASKGLIAERGIAVPTGGVATSGDEAESLFDAIGGPVVVKIASPDVVHKARIGAVRLGVVSSAEVRAAFDQVLAATSTALPEAVVEGVLVERQEATVTELIVSGFVDPTFGPMVAVGRGGSDVESVGQLSMALAPVSRSFALRWVESLGDETLADIVVSVSKLASESIEAEINPLAWTGVRWIALDAVVRT